MTYDQAYRGDRTPFETVYDRQATGQPGVEASPEELARRRFERAKAERERELVERALTNSPDYMAALRRAAIANVDGEAALASNRPRTGRARETAITAEEARLSDAVEQRRRQRLAQIGQDRQNQADAQAIAFCNSQGAQVEAAMYSRRSILNLEAAVAGAAARARCIEAYRSGRR